MKHKYPYFTKRIKNFFLNLFSFYCRSEQLHAFTLPTFVSIESSSICNLHCPECPVGQYKIKRRPFMDFSLFTKIIDEIQFYTSRVLLYFEGEPLLHLSIIDMIRYANTKRLHTYLSTNAQCIDYKMSKLLVEAQLRHLVISIDGTTQTSYEKYRVGGKLEKAIRAIELLNTERKRQLSKFPRIEVQFIVFRHNEQEIPTIQKLAKQWGADRVSIKSAQIYDYNEKPNDIPTKKKYSRYVFRNGYWQMKKKTYNRCFRSWTGAVISTEGDVYPCCFDKTGDFVFGNIQSSSLKQIWHSTKAVKFRNQIRCDRKKIPICNNCTE